MFKSEIVILQIIFLIPVFSIINFEIIENYLEEKSLRYVTIVGCYTKTGKLEMAKTLMARMRRRVSIYNVDDLSDSRYLDAPYFHLGVILDGDCDNLDTFLIKSGKRYFFDVKHHWLIMASTMDVIDELGKTQLNIDCDIYVAVSAENNASWTIWDIYNPASEQGGILHGEVIGHYNEFEGYTVNDTGLKYWNRKNMTGTTFKAQVVLPVKYDDTLLNYLDNDEHREINTFNRFHSRLMYFCRDYYNFTLNIALSKSWGYQNPDGSFDGIVGALERKLIDFGLSPLFFRSDRLRKIDYGRRTWTLRAAFLFRNPKVQTSFAVFLKPLSASIWVTTLGFIICFFTVFRLISKSERTITFGVWDTSWSRSVLFVLGAFCQQGTAVTSQWFCGRIVIIFTFLLSVLIYQFYSASIVSILLMNPVTLIKTAKDLLESTLKIGCEDILYGKDYFTYTTDKITRRLYVERILGSNNETNFLSAEKGLHLMEKGGYAFHVELATAYPFIERTFSENALCQLREIQVMKTQPMHLNFQKKSPFKEMLDTCFQRFAEIGLLTRELNHWHPRKPECIQSASSIKFNVGIDDLYPAFVMLLVGIVISILILIVEKYIHMRTSSTHIYPYVK